MPEQDSPINERGWRRLWPSALWLQTVLVPTFDHKQAGDRWLWRIWDEDKKRLLATGAENYTRAVDAVRGGKRFGELLQQELGKANGAKVTQT